MSDSDNLGSESEQPPTQKAKSHYNKLSVSWLYFLSVYK